MSVLCCLDFTPCSFLLIRSASAFPAFYISGSRVRAPSAAQSYCLSAFIPCFPCRLSPSLSNAAFMSPQVETLDSTEETRSADVYPALCCHKLFTSAYHAMQGKSQDECGVVKIAKKNYISLKVFNRFGSEGVSFLWSKRCGVSRLKLKWNSSVTIPW